MPFKIDFLYDVGRFWEGKWRQVGSKIEWKIDVNCGRRVFEKRGFSLGKTMILKVREVPRSMENLLKIDWKLKLKMEWLLAPIFHDFSWIWEAKLREKTIQNRVKKNIQSSYVFNIEKECIGSRFVWGGAKGRIKRRRFWGGPNRSNPAKSPG